MDRAQIIKELKATQKLRAECPSCGEEFTVSRAVIFDALGDIPDEAQAIIASKYEDLQEQARDLKDRETELRERKHSATTAAEQKALEVSLGLVIEKIVTGWNAFPHEPYDCRSLFEPIDYLAFDGMTRAGKVRSIAFIDVKTGDGRLNKHQRMIRDAVQDGRVDYREV